MVTAKETRPMGVDIFVATAIDPGVLGPSVEKVLTGLPVRLAQISSRGTKVYPNTHDIESDPVDLARLRFKVDVQGETLSDKDIAELLLRVGTQVLWVHVEKLFKYDGQPAFTKDQGED